MKHVALVKSATPEPHESISDADILVMISMIDYLITEVSRIDPVSAHHLKSARGSLADTVVPSALPRAH
jgi:hypothetical protein